MIKKYIESIIDCLKAGLKLYPIFMILLGLEVLLWVFGAYQYSLIGLINMIQISTDTYKTVLLAKLIVRIFASVIAYNFICFLVFRNLYSKIGINVRYKDFAKALWIKHFITMAIVFIPFNFILVILNNDTRIQGFMGYLLFYIFIILKTTIIFYMLQLISKKYISNNDVNNADNNESNMIFVRLGTIFVTVVLLTSPISYYLGNLYYIMSKPGSFGFGSLFDVIMPTQNSDLVVVVNVVSILFKSLYNTFLFIYISIAIFQATQKEIEVRSSNE